MFWLIFGAGMCSGAMIICLRLARIMLCVVTVEMGSMVPTLKPGDRVLVLRHWPAKWLRKGQIVIVSPRSDQLPPQPAANPFGVVPCIKRVVGLPGDTLITSLTELDEYHRVKLLPWHNAAGRREWHVPPRHFFVRGDNPGGVYDSLLWGPLPYSSLLGVAIKRLPSLRAEDCNAPI